MAGCQTDFGIDADNSLANEHNDATVCTRPNCAWWALRRALISGKPVNDSYKLHLVRRFAAVAPSCGCPIKSTAGTNSRTIIAGNVPKLVRIPPLHSASAQHSLFIFGHTRSSIHIIIIIIIIYLYSMQKWIVKHAMCRAERLTVLALTTARRYRIVTIKTQL